MFLHSMIQSLPVNNAVPPFHDKHTLNLSDCSKFHDTEPSSPWFCSPVPHLTVFNAIPPFHGTEPPSSWYYSPIPWCYSPIPFQETFIPWICSPIPWYSTNPFHDGVAPFHNTDSHNPWRTFRLWNCSTILWYRTSPIAYRYMNVGIGNKAPEFHFWEHIDRFCGTVKISNTYIVRTSYTRIPVHFQSMVDTLCQHVTICA